MSISSERLNAERAMQWLKEIALNAMYLNGCWQTMDPANPKVDLLNPARGEVIASCRLAGAQEVDLAVDAAQKAQSDWQALGFAGRAAYLSRLADALEARATELAALSTLNNGKPLPEAELDVSDAIACYRYYAALGEKMAAETAIEVPESGTVTRVNEPAGVCALIVPWNFPMVTTAWKLAPALLAGCTVVLKPSEVTLLPELVLGDLLNEIALPAGVVNILPGGAEAGAAMSSHPGVDKVSFTGSNAVGEKIMVQAARSIKNISLELGGKSPIVVFAGVDLEWACEQIIAGIFANAGQICSATSRLLVSEAIAPELMALLTEKTRALRLGDGFSEQTQMGPLVSATQQTRVEAFFAHAREENLSCLSGGKVIEHEGFFVQPTIYYPVSTESRLWREEIFGPVLVAATFAEENEAIALANDSDYGLAATVLTTNEEQANRVSRALRAGSIWINQAQIVLPQAGWGGFKRSGIGRELGPEGLSAFQQSKYILLP